MNDRPASQSPAHLLRSFGRRRGRKPSGRQEQLLGDLLPGLAIDLAAPAPPSLVSLFAAPVTSAWLEIGFGGAEHLLWQARENPGVGMIGAEPFQEGVVKALHGVEQAGLRNVRVHADDVRPLLQWLPPASLDRAFVLYPDPWPKKRHVKRRLVGPHLLAALHRVMKPGAELRLATDIPSYACAMLSAVRAAGGFAWSAREPGDWSARPSDWPQTRYEKKADREGRRSYYLRFVRDPD
jgi:tRNA (guanine-N7-)-methyltransferase